MPTPSDHPIYSAPLNVTIGRDGRVTLYLPDGHRVSLTPDAAARSAAVLGRSRGRPARSGEVIAADFGLRTAGGGEALGKGAPEAYRTQHYGPSDPRYLRQAEDRRRKPARAV